MTLIARVKLGVSPLYIGDLLLSKELKSGETKPSVDLPAVPDINAKLPVNLARAVVGLRQKVNLLDDNLILAWAGNFLQARSLARSIREAVRAGANNRDVITLIDQTPLEERNELALLGTVATPKTEPGSYDLGHFLYRAHQRHRGEIGVSAAGSGANDLFNFLPQILPKLDQHERLEAQVTKLGAAVSAFLVGQETTTGLNLLNWWGGALELAHFDDGRFHKVDNVLHTLWRARKISPDDFHVELRPVFKKYDYFDDALIGQNFELEPRSGECTRQGAAAHLSTVHAPA